MTEVPKLDLSAQGLAIAGESIKAGKGVFLAQGSDQVFIGGSLADTFLGVAVSDIREGFRVSYKDGQVMEDDA